MLFPVGHERNTVSRLPIVTVILIVTNILVFLLTNGTIEEQSKGKSVGTVRTHILTLKARYTDLTLSPQAQEMVDDFRSRKPGLWKQLTDNDRGPVDAWESALLADGAPRMDRLQAEMDGLCEQLEKLQTDDSSLLWQYAYHSYKPTVQSYITYQFLHGGWLHLISNMWILWLCGLILEDAWGHFVVLGFYLVGGVFAAFVHGWMNPHSVISMVGASGAIAALMGALLARFPRVQIKIAYLSLVRFRTFDAPVYVVTPLWFVAELFLGLMGTSGVAHWAHVGGFIFGVAVGFALYAVKIEDVANRPAPEETWTPDAQYLRASELLDQRETDRCIAEVSEFLRRQPSSREGWELLLKAQNVRGDHGSERDETLPALIRICLATADMRHAAEYIAQFRALGGTLPAPVWMEVARTYEKEQKWEQAAREYEHLGETYYASDGVALTALMSAARIYLAKLNRSTDAVRLYREAQNSPIPHLDLDGLIEQGLKQCAAEGAAKGPAGASAAGVSNGGATRMIIAAKLQKSPDKNGFPHSWDYAEPIHFDHDWQGKNADPQRETEVRVQWSVETLFLRFAAKYRTLYTFPSSNQRLDHLWERDVAETFLQPPERSGRTYAEFEVSPNGDWLDLAIASGQLVHLHCDMKTRVNVDSANKLWVAELAIPMTAITSQFDAQRSWRANFFRIEGEEPERFYGCWHPTNTDTPNFHVPEAFDTLKFAD